MVQSKIISQKITKFIKITQKTLMALQPLFLTTALFAIIWVVKLKKVVLHRPSFSPIIKHRHI
jgi:hypothetical protein